MAATINTSILAALRAPVAAYLKLQQAANTRRMDMKPVLDPLSAEDRSAHLKVAYAQWRGIPLTDKFTPVDGKEGAHWTEWEAIKKQAQRDLIALYGKAEPKVVDGIEVPAHIQALAAKLAAECAKHEQARKIAMTAIAQAFAG